MKELNNKIKQTMKKSITLQGLALEDNLPYDKQIKIREEHNKAYNKYVFFKKLKEAVEKGNKK